MTNGTRAAIVLLTATLALAASAQADAVLLVDGSRLIGQVQRLADGTLTVKTDFAGVLEIEAAKVKGVFTDRPLAVQLKTGDRAVGTMRFAAETGQTIGVDGRPVTAPEFGEITAIWPPDEDSPEVVALKAVQAEKTGKWSLRVEAGLNGQTGNTERIGFNGRIDTRFKTDKERLNIYAQGRFGRENGVRTVNEILGGAKLEVDVSDRWFAYGQTELEFDEFENLDLRTTVTAGMGYFLIKEEDQDLKLRAGAGYMHESFDDGTMQDQGVLELGVEYRKQINDRLLFTHGTTYFPSLDSLGDYRLRIENAIELALNKSKTAKLKAGVRNEYDARPQPGVDRLDTFYFMNLLAEIN